MRVSWLFGYLPWAVSLPSSSASKNATKVAFVRFLNTSMANVTTSSGVVNEIHRIESWCKSDKSSVRPALRSERNADIPDAKPSGALPILSPRKSFERLMRSTVISSLNVSSTNSSSVLPMRTRFPCANTAVSTFEPLMSVPLREPASNTRHWDSRYKNLAWTREDCGSLSWIWHSNPRPMVFSIALSNEKRASNSRPRVMTRYVDIGSVLSGKCMAPTSIRHAVSFCYSLTKTPYHSNAPRLTREAASFPVRDLC